MMTLIIFLVALSILIFVHEWGHFIVAKLSGIRVDIFSIGFGPKIFGFKWHGTEYRFAPFPFGGYVKIYGHDPVEEAEGDK
ncbi:site-2 protease family protein, partial [bacterium]|nr:site-2 protease family protein [bacterium]